MSSLQIQVYLNHDAKAAGKRKVLFHLISISYDWKK